MIKKRVYKACGFFLKMIDNILQEVKKNKKYKTIDDSIVKLAIKEHFNNKIPKTIKKQDIKNIRANLHKTYSLYQTKKKSKREKYLTELKQLLAHKTISTQKTREQLFEITNKILSTNISTKERLNDYPSIYQKIFEITNNPETIVDLASGINPLSFPYMQLKSVIYNSYDIDTEDIKFINNYFKLMKPAIKGKASILDINNIKSINKLPKSDIILLWKIIDIIDKKNHKPSEKLIKELIKKTKYIIASFSTKTITRKKMNFPHRKWFELMLARNDFLWTKFNTNNELFYVIHK